MSKNVLFLNETGGEARPNYAFIYSMKQKKKSKQIPYQNFAVRSIQNMRMKKIIQMVCLKIDLGYLIKSLRHHHLIS